MPSPAPAPASSCRDTNITGNHGHSVQIPPADVNSTTSMTYNIQGSATHNHTITINPAQFVVLRTAGNTVIVTSTDTQGHVHDVTVSCM